MNGHSRSICSLGYGQPVEAVTRTKSIWPRLCVPPWPAGSRCVVGIGSDVGCVRGIAVLTNGRDAAVAFVNIEQAEFWSQLAPTWLELEDQLEAVGRLPGELAMDRLDLLP